MNNTYKTNKTDWRRLMRSVLLVALLLAASLPAMAADYVFLYNSGGTFHILSNTSNTITDVTTFSYTNCVWSGTSGSTFSNQGRYLYWTNNDAVWTAYTSGDILTINNNKIYNYYNNRYYIYIRYNNNQWVSSTTDSQNEVVYQISTQTDNSLSTPTIASDDFVFTDLTSHIYSASATYSYKLYKLAGANTYYVVEGGTPSSSTTVPTTTDGITYVWSLADGTTDNGHVRINPSTGGVTYYNAYTDANHTVGIKVTATHSASGLSQTSSTKNITVNKLTAVNPTGITATDITVSQGNTITATNYTTTATLSAGQYPYSHVTATSDATDIATVANVGDGFTITGVAVGSATITIKAYNIGNSVVACSTTFTVTVTEPETGISGSIVILNDYEDHNWAYYNKELNSPIRSWNPADVKITYYGEGKMYTSTSTTPSGDLSNVTSGTVRVGILTGETQNTFVYYKTLERTDGQTADNPSGRCAYRTIPNPFSVRPTFTSGNTKYYTGFYKWRVKKYSGGRIYTTDSGGDSVRVGGTVDAEQVLYFAPTSEYGMTVEFEAIWARAYIGGTTHVTGTNAYERNFYIGARTSALSYAATISAVYPDGTDGTNTLTAVPNTTQTSSYTCSYDTKFEYIQMGASITLTANNHYLCLGRGCGTTNNVMTRVRGMSAGTSDALDYTMRIESGKLNYMAFVKGTYDDDYGVVSGYGGGRSADAFSSSTRNHARIIIGSDYDRANDINTNLYIYNDAAMGSYCAFSTPTNYHTLHATIKSGTIGATLPNLGEGGDHFVYLGVSRNYTNTGLRQLYIEGGQLGHLAGGIDGGSSTDTAIYVRMSGGHILGCMYGSGAFAAAAGIRKYVITGGNIQGWVAGGCNGVGESEGGTMDGETFLYIGGNGKIGYDATGASAPTSVNSVVGGTVFAAGRGNSTSGSGRVNNSTLVLADEAKVLNNAYGGGNLGFTQGTANVWLFGKCIVGGKVFGGSNIKGGSTNANVTQRGGTVVGGVYGGINGEGYTGSEQFHMSGNVSVKIEGGTVGDAGINPATSEVGHVFGSGFGNMTHIDGNVQVTIGATGDKKNTPVINGNVYGGGHNAAYTSDGKTFQVLGQNGLVKGSIFGGGKGNTATITGPTDVLLKGHITVDGNVYGGGDAATVSGNTSVRLQD